MDRKGILEKVHEVKYWRHRIDLGNGIFTPGRQHPRAFEKLRLPNDLSGKTVLDIGAWDGLFSFEAEKRGAKRVLATDIWYEPKMDKEWWEDIREGMKGFLTAREILNSKVEYKNIDVYDISPETVGMFDIVLFLGVLYHLKDPFLALRNVASVTKEMAIVETHAVKTRNENVPLMRFHPTVELGANPSNWWSPNLLCLKRLMLGSGFKRVEVVPQVDLSKYKANTARLGKIVADSHIRFQPDPKAEIITNLGKGDKVLVVGTRGDWYRVEIQIPTKDFEQKRQGWVEKTSVQVNKSHPMRNKLRRLLSLATGRERIKGYRVTVKGFK